MFSILLVAVGGFFGAVARYLIGAYFKRKQLSIIPVGTLLVNIIGSFLLGILIGYEVEGSFKLLAIVGFLGAFTTFSTFMVENFELMLNKRSKIAGMYILLSVLLGLMVTFGGIKIGHALL